MLKYILLGFLNYAPMTGYELKRRLDNSTSHFWHAYHSQIYTTLRRMEKDGLLASELDDSDDKLERREYTVTDKGRAALQAWLDDPMTDITPSKEALLVRTFFSAGRDIDHVLDELRLQRQLHQRQKAHYDAFDIDEVTREDLKRDAVFWKLTLEFGQAYEAMYLDWLDNSIETLEALKEVG